MASKGGGKIKSKGEHSPVKPYEQRKSFFQRLTDSIKDVLRPSWLADDLADDASPRSGQRVEKSAITSTTVFQEKVDNCGKESSLGESTVWNDSPTPRPPLHPSSSITPGNSTDWLHGSSGNATGLWSVASSDAACMRQQTPAISHRGPGEMVPGRSAPFGTSGSADLMYHSSQTLQADASLSSKLSRGEGGLASTKASRLNSAATRSLTSPQWHMSQSTSSLARQRQLRQRTGQGNNSFSGSPEDAACPGLKRQRLWTPEPSRKGRSLQPAVRDRPTFKMSVFHSSTLRDSEPTSPFNFGKASYGGVPSCSRQSLNSSLSFQNSPPVGTSVTPKPVNKPGSAVLSSSATQILKTLERLSDTRRPRLGLQDSQSLLSFTPRSNKRSRPLQRNFDACSKNAQACVEASDSETQEATSLPAAEAQVCGSSSVSADIMWSDHVVIANDSSDDDVQIIEAEEETDGRHINPSSCGDLSSMASQPSDIRQNASSVENGPKQTPHFHKPVKVAQSRCLSTSPFTTGLASTPSAFVVPPAWGSTAPKPKSIIAGNSKSSVSSHKSVSFTDSKSEEPAGSTTLLTEFRSGSVMDVLGKSPRCSSSKSSEQLEHGTASSNPAERVNDSLFAKFAPQEGSWECGACMVRNTRDLTQCLACQANKPGAASSNPAERVNDSLFAKFAPQEGSWECGACMVRNTRDLTQCLACQANKPGAVCTGTSPATATIVTGSMSMTTPASVGSSSTSASPFLASPCVNKGWIGGGQLGSASTASVPESQGFRFLAAPSGAGGFTFGAVSSTSSAFSTTGGFRLGTTASETVSFSSPAGFTFGKPNSTPVSKAGGSSDFQFGGKDLCDSQSAKDSGLTNVTSRGCDSTLTATGFQFGVSSASSVSSKNMVTESVFGSPPATGSDTAELGRTVFGVSGKTVFGALPNCEKTSSNADTITVGELTSSNISLTDSSVMRQSKSTPLASADKPCDTLSASPSQSCLSGPLNSSATGGFHCGRTVNSGSSPSFVFGSSASTKLMINGSDWSAHQNAGQKASSNSEFSFGRLAKSEQSIPPAAVSASVHESNLFASGASDSEGFVFGAPSLSPANSSYSECGVVSKPSVGKCENELALHAARSATNGEAGAVQKSAFSEGHAARSSATVGFSFGAPLVQSKKTNSGQNLFAPAMHAPFGAQSVSEVASCEAVGVDNDAGPDNIQGQLVTCSELLAADSAEPFTFASPQTIASSNTAFTLGHGFNGSEGSEADPAVDKQTSQVTGQSSGCGFRVQINAASSKELASSQLFLFGAGSGSTNTGQFSFSVGAGSQSNAAAASPLASNTSAPNKGFSFSETVQPSVGFGADSSSNKSAPVFQFASPQSVDVTVAQSSTTGTFTSGPAVFSFGKSTEHAPAISAPTSISFGVSAVQNSFSIGSGESPRKLKRAVRRVPRN